MIPIVILIFAAVGAYAHTNQNPLAPTNPTLTPQVSAIRISPDGHTALIVLCAGVLWLVDIETSVQSSGHMWSSDDASCGGGGGSGGGGKGSGGGSGRGVKEGGSMSLLVPVSFEPLGHVKAPGPGLAPGSLLAPGPGLALEHPPSAPLPFSSSFLSTATTTNNNNNTATANVHAYTTTPPTSSSTSSQPASTPAPGLALVPGAALGLALVPCASSTSDGADSYPFGQFNQSQDTHHFSNNNNDNQPPPSQQQQQGMKSIFR